MTSNEPKDSSPVDFSDLRGSLCAAILGLAEKYAGNQRMEARLLDHVTRVLPAALADQDIQHTRRTKRLAALANNSESFMARYAESTGIYYTPHNELFFKYDGVHYAPCSEDNIQHDILTKIGADCRLRPWKHRIKNTLMRRLRERTPLQHIPESATIRSVVSCLHPTVFMRRDRAKYFLTVVGDSLLSKSDNLTYVASPQLKQLVGEIGVQAHAHFGISGALQNVKYKFYEHPFATSRLLTHPRTMGPPQHNIAAGICRHIVDFLCVAAHYSSRYGSADEFLRANCDMDVRRHALYLADATPEGIVAQFTQRFVRQRTGARMSSRDMTFVWKKFLDTIAVPNVVFHGSLHAMLRGLLKYDEEQDVYIDVTSSLVSTAALFTQFWGKDIIPEEDGELDIKEIRSLFGAWCAAAESGQTEAAAEVDPGDNALLLDLIRHFHPDVTVEDDKYVIGVASRAWPKHSEVTESLSAYRDRCGSRIAQAGEPGPVLSIDAAYRAYTEGAAVRGALVVSKRYFERVALATLGDLVDTDGLIDQAWLDEE